MKKLLRITGISLLSILLLLILLPLLFKKQILDLVRRELNASLTAVVDFKDVDISFLRRFPRVSVQVEGLSVVGRAHFAGDTLLAADNLDAAVNLFSFFRNEKKVYSITFNRPKVHARIDREGRANWDIAKSDTLSSADSGRSAGIRMDLNHYSIRDGELRYEDETAGISARIEGLEHEGRGDLADDLVTISTRTSAARMKFEYEGIPFFNDVETEIRSDFQIDTRKHRYGFSDASLRINRLRLQTQGFVQLLNDSTYALDLRFDAPSTEFREVLSLIPSVYTSDFDALKTTGKAALKGWIKGNFGPSQLPAYELKLSVADGALQYPKLPQAIRNIALQLHASNPDGHPDHSEIDLSRGHLEMGGQPLDFHFRYRLPESRQLVDAGVKGSLSLQQVAQFLPLEKGTELAGDLQVDAFANGSLSERNEGTGAFRTGGFFNLSDFHYSAPDLPQALNRGNIRIRIENDGDIADRTRIDISQSHIELGKDPIDFSLKIVHPMSSVDFDGRAKGRITLAHLQPFLDLDKGTSISGQLDANLLFAGSKAAIDASRYRDLRIEGTARVSDLNYVSAEHPEGFGIEEASLGASNTSFRLQSLKGRFAGTRFTAQGLIDNLIGYWLKGETLRGNLNVQADRLDLNKWMGTGGASASDSSSAEPFAVPAGIDLSLQAGADQVIYDKVEYRNVQGALRIHDETLELKEVRTEALDGTVVVNGAYSTLESKVRPRMQFAYAVKDVDIQKAFYAFNTVQKLMPVGQFLSGKLSSQLSLEGRLTASLLPELSSLSGNGNLLLLEGVLRRFAPLDKIASTLNIESLRDLSLRDVRSHIDFSNGKVLVKPFQTKVNDIDLQIGGMHGFDQSLEYIVQMKVPRRYFGASGNALINNLTAQAAAKGLKVTPAEIVNLTIHVGGTIAQPSIRTELKEAAGDATRELKDQAASFVKARADSASRTVRDTVQAVKKQLLSDLKENAARQLLGGKDSTGNAPPLDSTKKQAIDRLRGTFKGLIRKKEKNR